MFRRNLLGGCVYPGMGSVTNISPDVASDLIPGYASLSLRSRYSANIGRQSYVVHARGGIAKGGTEPLFRSTSPGKILRDTLSPRLVCPLGLVCLADSPFAERDRAAQQHAALVLRVSSFFLRSATDPIMSEAQLIKVSSGRDKGEMDELKVRKICLMSLLAPIVGACSLPCHVHVCLACKTK